MMVLKITDIETIGHNKIIKRTANKRDYGINHFPNPISD